jgi:protein TonB
VILVKGAWSSASDSATLVPENATVVSGVFADQYFGMTYPLHSGWGQNYSGPPPSDSGRYVLAEVGPGYTDKETTPAYILITAQDMFFSPMPGNDALELVKYAKENLASDYKLEAAPAEIEIAGHSFASFAYWSPIAELHWRVLATEIRCHDVQWVLSSRNRRTLDSLVAAMSTMRLPEDASATGGTGGGTFPLCIKDYAMGESLITRIDPMFSGHRFNPVPVRIIIDKSGSVKHIHILSAFPDQTAAVTDALKQWKFKPYLKNGEPIEVETGIMFGKAPQPLSLRAISPAIR